MSEVEFTEERALAEACEATGLSDFGDERFRDGLKVLLETYSKSAHFNEKGQRRNWRRVVQLLSTRLRMQAAFARHPEIRTREVRRPMVLTGLPRSGTSALFSFLAAHPEARPLRLWEAVFPDPMEGLPPGQSDPRRDALEAHYAKGREKNPEFTKIHYTSADTPEECVVLMAHEFCDVQMGIEVMMEPYASWFRQQDFTRTYEAYANFLRMVDWRSPGERWILKAPAHLWALDVLVKTFPDVAVVWTHRNPLQCVASICSMTAALMVAREDLDPLTLGPEVMDFYATSLERGLKARELVPSDRFFDVDYRDFVSDPMRVAERIHQYFGLDFSSGSKAELEAHAAAHPQGQHGTHEYSLEQYGLTPETVRARFADYIRDFDLPSD